MQSDGAREVAHLDRSRRAGTSSRGADTGVGSIQKTLAVLEFVAERGGATAKEIAQSLGMPIATVYRLTGHLVDTDYLVHLKAERRFALGYKLHQLGVSLHRQIGVPPQVRSEIHALHEHAETAAYFAVYRGPDVLVAYVDDCPLHPRIGPLQFGMHEASHATAYGKIMLAGMTVAQRDAYFGIHPMHPLTPHTKIERSELERMVARVRSEGIAWEHEEFIEGMTCAAIAVRSASGAIVGSAAISSPSATIIGRERFVEARLRETASHVSRYMRTGSISLPAE